MQNCIYHGYTTNKKHQKFTFKHKSKVKLKALREQQLIDEIAKRHQKPPQQAKTDANNKRAAGGTCNTTNMNDLQILENLIDNEDKTLKIHCALTSKSSNVTSPERTYQTAAQP